MTKFALPLLALTALLALDSCRWFRLGSLWQHEEATPVSELGDDDFTHVAPAQRQRR